MKRLLLSLALLLLGAGIFAADDAETVTLSVDFSTPNGTIKPLNGSNLGPRLATARFNKQKEIVNDAHLSLIRLHDAPLDNAGVRMVDVPMIFGNFKDDPSDPENYFFEATDDYLKSILESGSTILYRLGTSIEHSEPNTYFAKEPKDHAKFAEICAGIIRHYNEGWGNGFHWNIEYWEIWNEPDCGKVMWDSDDFSDYCRFYVDVAKRLRAEFPNIKIGGPALTWPDLEKIGQLADLCREEGAPLDFCSWHTYYANPADLLPAPQKVRDVLDAHGFTETELHLNEWHYFPCSWDEVMGLPADRADRDDHNNGEHGMNGIDSAASCAYLLSRWQDTPLDRACYYCTELILMDDWGLIDGYGYPRKPYYVFQEFAEMLAETPNRAACGEAPQPYSVLAGTGPDGAKTILVSSFKGETGNLDITLTGAPESGTVTIYSLDARPDPKPVKTTLSYENGVLHLGKIGGSAVRFIKW